MAYENEASDNVRSFQDDAGGDNGTADRQSAAIEVIVEAGPTEVPLSSYQSRYEYPGPVSVRDRGTSEAGISSDSPKLADEGYVVEPAPWPTTEAFDIRNPAVAPDTAATKIWGS